MGIINRTFDASEQKDLLNAGVNDTTTGIDYPLMVLPRAMQIQDAKAASLGHSGTPTATLKIQRFITGAGNTVISISGALTHTAYGTSGYQTFSLPASGSSLLDLQKGDLLVATTGGASSAVKSLMVDVVLKNIQDIKSWY